MDRLGLMSRTDSACLVLRSIRDRIRERGLDLIRYRVYSVRFGVALYVVQS